LTFTAVVRVGRAKRVKRIRFEEEGLRRGAHVLVATSRGTELATLIDEPRREGEPRRRLRDSEVLSRLGAKEFWEALQSERAARAAESKLGEEPDVDLETLGGDPEVEARFLRKATQDDLDKANALLESAEPEEFEFFARSAAELNLPMKPVQVEHLIGGEKILFFFTSEDRVDFRELARRLQVKFKGRAELRRIPEREAAAMMGGIGVCGRELCCATHLKVLKPVTLKMARAQGRPVTAESNLGACGRLRCCLRYEMDNYAGREGKGCAGCGS
jgi:hypothetical protein